MSVPDRAMKLKDGKLIADQLSSMIAVQFVQAEPNAAGSYVVYDGSVYCLPDGHSANVSWANTTKVGPTNIGAEVSEIKDIVSEMSTISEPLKVALLQIASKVAYIDGNGEQYYNALYNALYGSVPTLLSISASFSPGGNTFYPGTALNDLKPYLTVTATYSDGTVVNVLSGYTLSGTLSIGTNTVTVSYRNKETTFTVNVSSALPQGYTQLEYINSAEGYADTGLNETQVARAEYTVQVTNVFYTKGNHILSAMNTFFPYLSGSNAGGDYSQIRSKLKGSEAVASGSQSYTWAKDTTYTLEGFVGESNDVVLNGDTMFSATSGNTASSSYTFLLFATQVNPADNGYRFHGRLYSMKIYGPDDTLLRNYIPCVNGSNVVGLYDTVTNTFLSSANQNSAFIAGPSV